jgi:prepilin-type N-terminal cleavage/methylation domain-containing protein
MNTSALNRSGFTLIELIFVIVIIGILSMVTLPALRLIGGDKRAEFVNQLSHLVQITWQNAVVTGKVHRIVFDSANREIRAEMRELIKSSDTSDKNKSSEYISAAGVYFKTSIKWNLDLFAIKDFYITNTKPETSNNLNFLIFPEGVTQPVIINFASDEPLSLVLNPFSAQFKTYDTYQTLAV